MLVSWTQHLSPRFQLDGRNSQAPRGANGPGLHRCCHCGHTARDLSATVTPEQRAVLGRFNLGTYGLEGKLGSSDLAGLLLYAEYCGAAQEHAARARALLHAAWVLDDHIAALTANNDEDADTMADLQGSADNIRHLAALEIRKSMASGKPLAPSPAGWAIYADVVRRAGHFEKAAAACRSALKEHLFEDDDALTVRDCLHHTLNLATDRDARAAWVDEAEARALDYPERQARRQAQQTLQMANRKASATIERREKQARVAPARLVELLSRTSRCGDGDAVNPDRSAGLPDIWPLPAGVRTVLVESARAYLWPKSHLGLVLAAALAQVLGEAAVPMAAYLAQHRAMLQRLDDEVAYLAVVLRETTLTQWAFRAPPGGFKRGAAAAERARAPTSVQTVREEFERRFHVTLPDEFWPSTLQVVPGEHLLSTHPEQLREWLIGPTTAERLKALPDGYLTIGFWGYGSNSYAFYLISKREREQLNLRLHTGGAYTDPAQAAAEITDFVPVLLMLLNEVRKLGGRLVAVQGIDKGEFTVAVGDRVRQLQGSLMGRPEGMTAVQRLLNEVQGLSAEFDPAPLAEQALKIAMQQYADATRAGGNVRIPMRALGSAMNLIRRGHHANNASAWRHQLFADLAALAERHTDEDGDHDGGRRAIRKLIEALKNALPG